MPRPCLAHGISNSEGPCLIGDGEFEGTGVHGELARSHEQTEVSCQICILPILISARAMCLSENERLHARGGDQRVTCGGATIIMGMPAGGRASGRGGRSARRRLLRKRTWRRFSALRPQPWTKASASRGCSFYAAQGRPPRPLLPLGGARLLGPAGRGGAPRSEGKGAVRLSLECSRRSNQPGLERRVDMERHGPGA